VKKALKAFLKTVGLYDFALRWYHMAIHFSWRRLALQFKYRFSGAPDGYPVPPPRLVHKIIARGWAEQYWQMGKDEAERIVTLLHEKDVHPAQFERILDFGCGSGRVIRHFQSHSQAELFGSDYNPRLISWCQQKLKFGSFGLNQLEPPLDYPDDHFDFIYLISVFTHLSGPLQKRWLAELLRITKPGGHILFTTHGNPFLSLLDEEQAARYNNDELVIVDADAEGTNHYGSFQNRANVEQALLNDCSLIAFREGAAPLEQDKYLVRKDLIS